MPPYIDRISSLPENILCHILSFLPTTQSVATSVLSHRWTNIWRNVPTLNLTDVLVYNRELYLRFNEFVNSVLLSRNYIQSCIIRIGYDDRTGRPGFPNLINWINAVVQRRVAHLEIYGGINLKLQYSILTCRTLVDLRFHGFVVKEFSCVTLHSLKFLYLLDCKFTNARDFILLLAGCPVLEELYACSIECHSNDSLTYHECERLELRRLRIVTMPGTCCHFPLKALCNVKQMQIEINKVYRRFDEIPTFHNLVKLKLHSINYNWSLFVRMLHHCPNLQSIEISQGLFGGDGRRGDTKENWTNPTSVPRCLSLHLKTCILSYLSRKKDDFLMATYILKNAKVLQTMAITCHNDPDTEREFFSCPKASATCQLLLGLDV